MATQLENKQVGVTPAIVAMCDPPSYYVRNIGDRTVWLAANVEAECNNIAGFSLRPGEEVTREVTEGTGVFLWAVTYPDEDGNYGTVVNVAYHTF